MNTEIRRRNHKERPPRYAATSRRHWPLATAVMALLWIGPILACGSFQPRPTLTPQPLAVPIQDTPEREQVSPTPTPTLPPPPSPTATEIATATPTPVPSISLKIGEPARIIAAGGLNIREQPNTGAPIVVRLGFGKRVLVMDGPISTDELVWWQVDDNQGNVGWAAAGQGAEEWITSQIGEPQPVNRSPSVGDRIVVTLNGQLSVRALPGTNSVVVARVNTSEQFSVVAGPQAADGYLWFQIRSDDGQVEGWAADGRGGERWLSPLE